MAGSLLLRGARLLRGAGDAADPPAADLLIRDGRIAEIVLAPAAGPAPAADRVIDARGKLVIPGLVNAHYHSHDVLARGLSEDLPLEAWIALAIPPRRAGEREVRLRTLLGAAECLVSGVTTVQDMMGTGPGGEAAVEWAMRAYAEIGIRCVLGLQVGNRSALDCLPGWRGAVPDEHAALLDPPQAPTQAILDYVAAPLGRPAPPRLTWAIAPGSPQRCSLDLLEGLGALAAAHRLPVVTHVNESKVQVALAQELAPRFGRSWVGYLEAAGLLNPSLAIAHGVWLDDNEIARIAAAGAGLLSNPASNLKLKNGVAPLRKLAKAGVRLGLGCDNVSAGDAQNMFQAMKLAATMSAAKGADPGAIGATDAFTSATATGAELIGLGGMVGRIAVGMAADLALIDLADPAYVPLNDALRQLVYSECGRGVRTVLIDGEVVVEDGRLTRLDWPALVAEAAELARPYRAELAAHAQRLAPLMPHFAALARRTASAPLGLARWLAADDTP